MLHPHHLEDLKKSGLSDSTIEALGFYSADAPRVEFLLGRSRSIGPGLVIPYPGSRYFRVKPDRPPKWWGKEAKYLARKGAGNAAYIPPRTQAAIAQKKPKKPILITEGEKKAAKADQEGFPCIGISGVWCFQQDGRLIADLANLRWAGRRVYLVYDSDFHDNQQIRRAACGLAWELIGRGALVFIVPLPTSGSEKVGLDDYLVAEGEERLRLELSRAKALIDTREAVGGGSWLEGAIKGVDEGQRHRFLGRLALKLKHDGWPRDVALPILRGSNGANRVPLPEEDVEALAWFWAKWRSKKYIWGQGGGSVWKGRLPPAASKLEEACQLLRRMVTEEPIPAQEVKDAAKKEGIKPETLKRAKENEGIKSFQRGRIWWWWRPPGRRPSSVIR